MVTVGTIGQIRDSRPIINVLMSPSEEEHQFMIGWGAGLMCMKGLVDVSVIFQGIKKNLKKWRTHRFPMNSYSKEIRTFIMWIERKFAISQFGRQSFHDGVQKV